MFPFSFDRHCFLLIGDSITQGCFDAPCGWGSSLAQKYSRYADIICRGLSGYNTRWWLEVIDVVLREWTSRKPSLITICLGANDAALIDGPSSKQHVPLKEFAENIRQLIKLFKEHMPNAAIVILSPPPIAENFSDQALRMNPELSRAKEGGRSNCAAGEYANACQTAASELSISFLNIYSIIQQQHEWQTTMLKDGLHLSAAGNQLLFEELCKIIDKDYPQLSVGVMLQQFPYWGDIDPYEWKRSFIHPK